MQQQPAINETLLPRAVRFMGGFRKGYRSLSTSEAAEFRKDIIAADTFTTLGNFYAAMGGARLLTRAETEAVVKAFGERGITDFWDRCD